MKRTEAISHQPSAISQKRRDSQRGVALILTLAILTLVTLLVIAFASSMRVENTASKNYNDLIKTRQLAQAAVDEAVAKIRDATQVPTIDSTWAAAPGVIYVATRGAAISPKLLYTAGTDVVDINANNIITGINVSYPQPSPINVS
jgi:Tfp pilus assembly protein PilX